MRHLISFLPHLSATGRKLIADLPYFMYLRMESEKLRDDWRKHQSGYDVKKGVGQHACISHQTSTAG